MTMDATKIIVPLLRHILPPEFMAYVENHVLHPESLLQGFGRFFLRQIYNVLGVVLPFLEPTYNRLFLFVDENQGFFGFLVSLGIITVVVILMNWIRLFTLWCTRIMFKLMFFGCILAVVAVAWERGFVRTVMDVVMFAGRAMGYMASVKEIWLKEYDQYEQSAKAPSQESRIH